MNTKTVLIALAAAGSFAIAPAALAQETDEGLVVTTNSVLVSFGDLNLNSERGIQVLDRRIRFAAETVCGGQAESNVMFGGPSRQCQRETIARVAPIRSRILAAARSGDTSRFASATLVITRDEG